MTFNSFARRTYFFPSLPLVFQPVLPEWVESLRRVWHPTSYHPWFQGGHLSRRVLEMKDRESKDNHGPLSHSMACHILWSEFWYFWVWGKKNQLKIFLLKFESELHTCSCKLSPCQQNCKESVFTDKLITDPGRSLGLAMHVCSRNEINSSTVVCNWGLLMRPLL